jgi:hypothetical protein
MWHQLLAALLMSLVTVSIHVLGSHGNFLWILHLWKEKRSPTLSYVLLHMIGLVAILLILHSLEISLWAEFYLSRRFFPDRETAYYFSLTSYTTLGFGDIVLRPPWRILSGWEAMTGVLMFGWSTATLVTFLHHAHQEWVKKYLA